ncbi:hypothetical protein PC119_g22868 [Phytophthora cactorum]|uniref:Uncharacterized protein n=1 Tax=Phytophthora cactorum TaxID=29920 RepID=A0A8T1BA90_9STRA|nr:hypothetical protein PC112_g21130 [Phytophthora cactorum]KAG2799011.1 hypothetical protein PC111_g20606 [Phytophthora cactorum]KAG2896081.1 hypothetical protein PC117_g23092 [Phytophthora cactorum]KAG2973611.1 hypothetical protein PC119_g22868 [Phytophthora cactorum]KAG2994027.1 hypothetical protein PC120_g22116 [Phytophthora cactorum]
MMSSGNSRRPERLHAMATMRFCIEAVVVMKGPSNGHTELWLRVETRTGGMTAAELWLEDVELSEGAVAASAAGEADKLI